MTIKELEKRVAQLEVELALLRAQQPAIPYPAMVPTWPVYFPYWHKPYEVWCSNSTTSNEIEMRTS